MRILCSCHYFAARRQQFEARTRNAIIEAEVSVARMAAAETTAAAAESAAAARRNTAETAAAAAESAAAAVHNHNRPLFSPVDGANAVVAAAQAVYERAGLPYPTSFPQQVQVRGPGLHRARASAAAAAADDSANDLNRLLNEYDTEYEDLEDSLHEEDRFEENLGGLDDEDEGRERLGHMVERLERERYERRDARHVLSEHSPQRRPSLHTAGVASTPPPASPTGSTASQGTLRSLLSDAKTALEEAHNELLCQICYTNRRDALIMPCLHLLYCGECVDRVAVEAVQRGQPDRCPCCRQSVCGVLRCRHMA